MHPLSTPADLDALRHAAVALVYKHSTRCPISIMAWDEVEALGTQRPDVPIGVVDVIEARALSRHVAESLGVVHHSPQAILLVHGAPAWAGSHFEVRTEAILRRVDAALAPPERRMAG
ncbi:bacillithiol system redox-active protein YtxJ [Roseisolibacter sp. H3M3-2]|uniref:bacillithiol system redox-active protein YtxJ n=1 Tax=Roseisolibacter sp. H3M3-2 TaxID=3031323 RepID=UPI0023DC0C85|nr:bacillithiol system redox-active protein YtxJ [Roseisolibacter sp. H3M3-2]MDF1501764.1 bacillithiol system redox-active protein YtxJ [Roseisolibacter sp. H3M3-2]